MIEYKKLKRVYATIKETSKNTGVSEIEIKNQIKESLNLDSFKNLTDQQANDILIFLILLTFFKNQ